MPQARADLSEMFPNGDEQAFRILGDRFVDTAGMIRPVVKGYEPTPQEFVALEYLCDEWDYSYDLGTGDI